GLRQYLFGDGAAGLHDPPPGHLGSELGQAPRHLPRCALNAALAEQIRHVAIRDQSPRGNQCHDPQYPLVTRRRVHTWTARVLTPGRCGSRRTLIRGSIRCLSRSTWLTSPITRSSPARACSSMSITSSRISSSRGPNPSSLNNVPREAPPDSLRTTSAMPSAMASET